MKSSASASKPFQSRSKGEIPDRARRKEQFSRSKLKQAFLTDSDTELFMYLIQCIRFGSWKVRRLNRARCVVTNPRNLKSIIFFWIIPTKRTLKLVSANSDQQRYFSQKYHYIIKGKGYEYLKWSPTGKCWIINEILSSNSLRELIRNVHHGSIDFFHWKVENEENNTTTCLFGQLNNIPLFTQEVVFLFV